MSKFNRPSFVSYLFKRNPLILTSRAAVESYSGVDSCYSAKKQRNFGHFINNQYTSKVDLMWGGHSFANLELYSRNLEAQILVAVRRLRKRP